MDRASTTAVLVAQGRAVADGRLGVGPFGDPTARQLLRANAEVMTPRTVAIDDAIRAAPSAQVVVLGAGLDGRAWRMVALGAADVFEVDHPASQRAKVERLGGLTPVARSVHFVPVDFTTDDLDAALDGGGHHSSEPTTWVSEGVVPYLSPLEVGATVRIVAARSAPGSRFVAGA